MKRIVTIRATLVAFAVSSTAFAQQRGVELLHGPIASGTQRVFDLRTGRPNALVLIFRSHAGGNYVPADVALPALAVVPGTAPSARTTNAVGRVRIVQPATSSSAPIGRSAFQALVRAPDGRWEASNPVNVRREAAAPAANWFAESATSPLPASAADLGAHAALAVDLDRDGDAELVLAHGAGVSVWIDDGAVGFTDTGATRIPHPTAPVSCLASADIDRDGDVDLFTGGAVEGLNVWPDRMWRNDGSAFFSMESAFPGGDGSTSTAEFGDVDGDADADLLIARGSDGHGGVISPCQLLRNASGTFTSDLAFESMPWNHALTPCPAARFGDVDDDGDLDVFIARSDLLGNHNGDGEPNALLVNDGTGAFTDESLARFTPLFSDNSLDAAFADVDLDGDLDIAVANSVSSVLPQASGDLWINQGGAQGGTPGFFVDDATSPLESTHFLHRLRLGVTVGDADTDGDLDLLVPVHDLPPASQQMLLVNQGGAQHGILGRFELATWFSPGGFVASGATFFDRDHDGDMELVLPASGTLTGQQSTSRRVLWIEATLP